MRVGVNKNSIQEQLFLNWAEEHGVKPLVEEFTVKTPELLEMLERGEIDALVTLDTYGVTADVVSVCKVGSANSYFGISEKREDIKKELDVAMNRILENNRSFNEQLTEKFNKASSISHYLTLDEKNWVEKHRVIKVGYLEDYLPFCGKWKLYEGDQSLIAYSAGITFRNLDSIRTVVTIAGDTATIHISDTDGKEIISLDSPFGETNFVLGTDRSRYYVRLNQLGHCTYLRYDGDPGSVPVGSCEYRPES
jgi:hypothetical protein